MRRKGGYRELGGGRKKNRQAGEGKEVTREL
jgi:hypothetical protein